MSAWKFKDAQKTQDLLTLHFSDLAHPPWGDNMSVTIAAADAAKLLARLQAILHPSGASGKS